MFRINRERRVDPDRFLDLKIALFVIGSITGVIGMARNDRTMITIAMAIIALGIILRFIGRKRAASDPPSTSE